MSAFNKIDAFVENLAEGVHDLGSDALKVLLTNADPSAGSVKADLTEISPGSGYTAGGNALTGITSAQASGTYSLKAAKTTFTASGGSIGPFRYAVLYNDTPTDPADPLIGYWDYGSSITLADGETLDVKPSDADSDGTVLTLT